MQDKNQIDRNGNANGNIHANVNAKPQPYLDKEVLFAPAGT